MSADRFGNINPSQRCLAVEAQLFDYVDSALTTRQMQVVEEHLAGCEQCRFELEHIRRSESALAAAPLSIPASGDLYTGFAYKLEVQQSQHSLRASRLLLRYITPALALGGLALILLVPTHRNQIRMSVRTKAGSSSRIQVPMHPDYTTNRWLAQNLAGVSEGWRNGRVSRLSIKSSVPTRKHTGEHRTEFAIASGSAIHGDEWKAMPTVVRSTLDGVELADNPRDGRTAAANIPAVQTPEVHTPGVANSYTDALAQNNLMYYRIDGEQTVALGLEARSYLSRVADQEAGDGFALVVQDDERGFTAEAHNTASTVSQTSRSGVSDDGVKVEIEFDGAAGSTSYQPSRL